MTQRELLNALHKGYTIAQDREDGFLCLCDLSPHFPYGHFFFAWTIRRRSLEALLQKGLLHADRRHVDFVFFSLQTQLTLPFYERAREDAR